MWKLFKSFLAKRPEGTKEEQMAYAKEVFSRPLPGHVLDFRWDVAVEVGQTARAVDDVTRTSLAVVDNKSGSKKIAAMWRTGRTCDIMLLSDPPTKEEVDAAYAAMLLSE